VPCNLNLAQISRKTGNTDAGMLFKTGYSALCLKTLFIAHKNMKKYIYKNSKSIIMRL